MTDYKIGTQWGPVHVDRSSGGERIHIQGTMEPSETEELIDR